MEKISKISTSENIRNSVESHSFDLYNKCKEEVEEGNFYPEIKRNKTGKILSPNGKVTKLPNEEFVKITRTPSFKNWFGDWINDPENSSKVIDEKTGEPLLVFHGSGKNFELERWPGVSSEDDPERENAHMRGTQYFTSNSTHAYAWPLRHKSNEEIDEAVKNKTFLKDLYIFSAFLNIKKPLFCNSHDEAIDIFENPKLSEWKKSGEYGVIQPMSSVSLISDAMEEDSDQFVIFTDTQKMLLPNYLKGRQKM